MLLCALIPHRKSSAEAGRCRRFHRAGGQRETLHLLQQPSGETGQSSKPTKGDLMVNSQT